MQGVNKSTEEFTPSAILSTLSGIGQGLWHFVKEPYTLTHECAAIIQGSVQEIIAHLTPEQIEQLIPEIKEVVKRWHSINTFEQGRFIGKIIGKYGVDIFACAGTMKIVKAYHELKYTNASMTLSACAKSVKNRNLIHSEVAARINQRKNLFKDGKIEINWARQHKHIPGEINFNPTKGRFWVSKEELSELILEKFGTGQPVLLNIMPFSPGYKERVNFGKLIGEYALKIKDQPIKFIPTTNGIIVYSKNGVHVIPSNPDFFIK
jgi:hypothetical protein